MAQLDEQMTINLMVMSSNLSWIKSVKKPSASFELAAHVWVRACDDTGDLVYCVRIFAGTLSIHIGL